jgi:predicted MFS family arabinose efflux permease
VSEHDDIERGEIAPPPLHEVSAEPPRLLANRPFVWLVGGELLAGTALWAFFLAVLGDASYRFDATPGQLGFLLACFSITFIPSAPAFGTVADRWSPKLMIMLGVVGFAGPLAAGLVADSLGPLYLSMALAGVAEGAIWPARGALVPRLVARDRLVQANGMIGAARELPLIVGPAAGGFLAGLWGRGAPYLLALGLMMLSLGSYALVPDRRAERRSDESFLRDLGAGLRAGMRVPVLRVLFSAGFLVMLLFGVFQVLEPALVRSVLGRGQDALGFLWSMGGVGAFAASLALVRLRRAVGAEVLILGIGVVAAGVGTLVYAGPGIYGWAIVGSAVIGVGFALFFAMGQALIQRISDSPGKVSGVFVVIGEIGPLLAAVGIGALGTLDVQEWFVGAGVLFVVVGALVLWATRRPAFLVEQAPAPGP